MTMLIFLLTLVLFVAIGLGLALWSLRRYSGDFPVAPPSALSRRAVKEVYQPIDRLFLSKDLAFLRQQPGYEPHMERHLRLQRRGVLLLYLEEMQREFQLLQSWCRILIRETQNWELSFLAHRQLIVFSSLLLALRMRCFLSLFVYLPVDTAGLLSCFGELQQGVRAVVKAAESDSRSVSWARG